MITYSEKFLQAVLTILKNEGGYVHDPSDLGGETKYGISKRAFPDLDIKNLTEQDALRIYHTNYWLRINGDLLPSYELATQVLDMAVNAGPKTAIRLLQVILKVTADGSLGPITLNQLGKHTNLQALVERYRFERAAFYSLLVVKNPSQLRFLKGWINRIY